MRTIAGYLTNSMYAPLVSTFMRAFPRDTDAVVYFTYSPLNDTANVKKVHVSVVNQLNNENALADITGVLIYETASATGDASNTVGFDTDSGMYYVVIPRNSLRDSNTWNINQYYKVQLRLDNTDGGEYSDVKSKSAYLTDNLLNFSEWSSVCLLRPIEQPSIQLRQWDTRTDPTSAITYNKGIIPINGRVIFGELDSVETETLQSYKIEVMPRNSNQVVYSTKNIYTGDTLDPNDINYKLNLQALDTTSTRQFTMRITITTKNQYVMSKDYLFDIADFIETTDFHPVGVNEDPSDSGLRVIVNDEEGTATFHFVNQAALYGILYVKRSSSISDFLEWESIYEAKVSDTVDLTIVDNTIGSHIWYRYSIQFENNAGGMSQVYYSDIFFPQFFDAFITRKDVQLDVRYDFKVSSMKPVVNRAKLDTLGGKYPKFAENAVLNYKQFSITGTISSEADYNQLMLNKRQYFGGNYQLYESYLSKDKIVSLVRNDSKDYVTSFNSYLTTTMNDWFWEREFREEAIKWLNDGEPKLFRSMTEGLIPVMITDINLTPKQQLNRMIYDFSATMYEIADGHSLEVLDSLGIIDIPKIEQSLGSGSADDPGSMPGGDYRTVTTIGQAYDFYPTDNNNILTSGKIYHNLMDKYSSGGVYSQREVFDIYIKDVQIYFHNDPHMFVMGSDNNIQMITTPTAEQLRNNSIQMGYTFQLQTSNSAGWETIFVNERGYYQIPSNLNITGIGFNQYSDAATGRIGDRVTINYVIVFKERSASGTIITGQTVDRTIVGQYQNIFRPNEWLGEKIRSKYNYITEQYVQQMQYWKGLNLDVTPYAIAHIKYHNQSQYIDYVVGQTGTLNLLKDFPIDEMCFLGKSMTEQPIERKKYLAEHEFVMTNESADSPNEIKHPVENGVYTIADKLQIYYNGDWYDFTRNNNGTGIAAVNIEGAINFLGDIVQTTTM